MSSNFLTWPLLTPSNSGQQYSKWGKREHAILVGGSLMWVVLGYSRDTFYFPWNVNFVTRDLKALRDPWRTWIINRYSWFYHSILRDFETQVLWMVRVVYREWRFAIWSLDLAIRDFASFKHCFQCMNRCLKRVSYFLIFVIRENIFFLIREPWPSIF